MTVMNHRQIQNNIITIGTVDLANMQAQFGPIKNVGLRYHDLKPTFCKYYILIIQVIKIVLLEIGICFL